MGLLLPVARGKSMINKRAYNGDRWASYTRTLYTTKPGWRI